jgi:hypothetical protein
MSEGPWFIFMAVVMYAILMTRLDRLGKQIEATSALIGYYIAPTEERRDDILKQWKQMQQQANTDARRFWIFSACAGVAALILYAVMHKG